VAQSPGKQDFQYPYLFVETSDWWKDMCSILPCFPALAWSGYLTKCIDTTINGHPVVIQLWKGWCQKFFGRSDFPGGIGAEVGIYRRISKVKHVVTVKPQPFLRSLKSLKDYVHGEKTGGPRLPSSSELGFLPAEMKKQMLDALSHLKDGQFWWPYPELGTVIEWQLERPDTGQVFFRMPRPQTTYWCNRWMDPQSYNLFKADPKNNAYPSYFDGWRYRLRYKIIGQEYLW